MRAADRSVFALTGFGVARWWLGVAAGSAVARDSRGRRTDFERLVWGSQLHQPNDKSWPKPEVADSAKKAISLAALRRRQVDPV